MTSGFAKLAATLDYPLYVVTAAAGAERTGCLIGFGTQCSIHPPRFLACISRKNHTLGIAARAGHLAVHVVEEKNKDIAELFGGQTGDEVDKFAAVRWHDVWGIPVLEDCERWFIGSILRKIDLGDHVGFLLEPCETEVNLVSDQLTVHQAQNIEPGHKP